jgi:hypothetical protein
VSPWPSTDSIGCEISPEGEAPSEPAYTRRAQTASPEIGSDEARQISDFHLLAEKYWQAAERPWLPVGHDPTTPIWPEGVPRSRYLSKGLRGYHYFPNRRLASKAPAAVP